MKYYFFILGLVCTLSISSVFAASDQGDSYSLTTAGGIAAPSAALGLDRDNPAGIGMISGTRLLGALYSSSSSLSPLDFAGRILFGNGSAGIGGGVDTDGDLSFGGAARIDAIHTAFGVRASKSAGWSFDLGLNFNPGRELRFGAVLYNLSDGVGPIGAGLAYRLGANADFALDAGFDLGTSGFVLKPGVNIEVQQVQFMLGYGFDVDGGGGSPVGTGVVFGLGFKISQSVVLQYYYHHLAVHYLGLQASL